MLDYADTDNRIFNMLKQPMVDAAYAYTRENSLYWQVESRMRLDPEADIDLIEAYEAFKEYVYATTKERNRDRRTDFKQAIKAMLGSKIVFDTRTKGPHKNRAFIQGLGHAVPFEVSEAGNVVSLDSARKS
jgi:hypothetical protein